jgi:diguanylate cyclase (GGDEF)-like protein
MISLKRYLDSAATPESRNVEQAPDLLTVVVEEYGTAIDEMGNVCLEACPSTGEPLKKELGGLRAGISWEMEPSALSVTGGCVREQLKGWGHATARHYQEKANEVKEMLLVMARTAESVSARDERCAEQMNEVTERLRAIATLEDLTEIRVSIERSACELKTSIERMAVEGKAALDALREQVTAYQTKLDNAEAIAARDTLTGLGNRLHLEGQIEKRIAGGVAFCVALIDIDGFKRVNDQHGHLIGDDLLKQFAAELRSACHTSDVIGRWGGDEFLLILDCGLAEAEARIVRLRNWICGSYTIRNRQGELKLQVVASIGLAEHAKDEEMKELIERADITMYAQKGSAGRNKRWAEFSAE